MNKLDYCRFCNIITNYNIKDTIQEFAPSYNKILYETANFMVLPALGSLVPGYVMIISKKHIPSMAYLLEEEMEELISLVDDLKKVLISKFGVTPILFEHGSALENADKSACSVEHAHWHLLSIHLSKEKEIIQDMNAFNITSLQSISSYKKEPYLLYVNEREQYYISHKMTLPSQYMRKWIAKEIGCALEWDWRSHQFMDNINSTIKAFEN